MPNIRHDLEFVSIPNVVRKAAARWPDAEAVVDGELRWSFQELEERMLDAVKATIAAGVRAGDRVALLGPNTANWIVAAVGIHGAGGVLVPVNTRFRDQEIAHVLRTSGATVLICAEDFLGIDYVDMLRAGAPEVLGGMTLVALGETKHEGVLSWSDYLETGRALADEVAHRAIDAVSSDDLSDIMFTSGTTGLPKGVQLTHGQSLRVFGWVANRFTFTPGDRYLIIPPFFHTFGYKAGWLANLMYGVTTLPQMVFDVDQILHRIQDEKVTILLGPPTLFIDLINHPHRGDFDLSSLRVTCPSAANVPVELVKRCSDTLHFDEVFTAYGLTEATSFVTSSESGDDPDDVADSVGRVMDDIEVVVVDAEGQPVGAGVTGEVLVRGYNVMRGYWNDPVATAEVIDADGWLHTGDIGRFNERGFLKITDRKKDVVIVGGFNVYPAEVEHILANHEDVAHVAVVGADHPRYGEAAVAYVVPMPGSTVTSEQLIDFARTSMANFKVPRAVVLVADLPRNASLKVLKGVLREQSIGIFQPAGS